MPDLRTHYRPVGAKEMLKILQSGAREFPPLHRDPYEQLLGEGEIAR